MKRYLLLLFLGLIISVLFHTLSFDTVPTGELLTSIGVWGYTFSIFWEILYQFDRRHDN